VNLATAHTLTGDGLAGSPLTVAIFDSELRIVWANNAAEGATFGLPPQDSRGRRLAEVMQEIDADAIEESLRRVLATGEPVLDLVVTNRVGAWAEEHYWSCIQFPVRAPAAGGTRVVHMMRDVTERAVSQRRLALTERASAHIGETLDTTQTAQELLDVAVPQLADVAAVDLLTTVIDGEDLARQAQHEGLRLQRVAMRWSQGSPASADYASIGSMETNPASLHHRLMVAGRPMFLPTFGAMSTEQIMQLDVGAGRERLLVARQAGAHSLIIVPLIARGVIMGLVVMYRLRGSRPFSSADLSLASDLVSRASLSIDNARLYTRERASALVLQRALLPRDIPDVPGVDLCHRYVPAATAAEVGGDWFDVITLRPGRHAFIVGDVTGHDIHAASVMGQLRTATRTLASLDLTPAELLGRLDRVTVDLTDQETFATCVYAVHDAAASDWEIASAGHPPPVLATPGRQAGFLDLPPGLPLGVGAGHYQATRIKPPPGSTLVLYTDGLIESPGTDIGTGMASLADALTMLSELTVDDTCDALLSSLAPKPTDDIAVLMARSSAVARSPAGQPDRDRTRTSPLAVPRGR
jgi:PAS domain S-box-containing protein